MSRELDALLYSWPKPFIRDIDLNVLITGTANSRYALVKRALKKGTLIKLKQGLYLIGQPYKTSLPNLYEIAQLMYGPSYISLESALSYHAWIPEAVYTTTSVTPKRAVSFNTNLGQFSFSHTPSTHFYEGVDRIEMKDAIFLMASPWKALADYMYVYKKTWKNIEDISQDLRIEIETLQLSDRKVLKKMLAFYPSRRVKLFLQRILQELPK